MTHFVYEYIRFLILLFVEIFLQIESQSSVTIPVAPLFLISYCKYRRLFP